MRVLGVDPGLRLTGYGCVEMTPAAPPVLIEAGVIRIRRAQTGRTAPEIAPRLLELDADFRAILARLRPDAVGVEQIFTHPKHPGTGVIMAHARGVLLLAAAAAGLPLVELRPTQIKKSLTSYGQADKAQMQKAIQGVFGLDEPPSPPDVADALAIALCAGQRLSSDLPAPTSARSARGRRLPPHLKALIDPPDA